MDAIRNPYVPNAGAAPPTLPGRAMLLEDFNVALERVRLGRSTRSLLPYGLRGVGKTVLLRRFVKDARSKGYLIGVVEADDRADFIAALAEQLRRILYELDTPTAVQALAKRAMRIFKSFTIKFGLDGLSVDVGVDDPAEQSDDAGCAVGDAEVEDPIRLGSPRNSRSAAHRHLAQVADDRAEEPLGGRTRKPLERIDADAHEPLDEVEWIAPWMMIDVAN